MTNKEPGRFTMGADRELSYAHLLVDQGWSNYSPDQHESWKMLYERQMEMLQPRACPEYLQAVEALGFTADKIPDFNEINERRSEERRVGEECRCRWSP